MKIACVVHRFGPDVAGGSEGHCRTMAEHLSAAHEVTVLTTCARDHITWANTYPAGESEVGRLRVHRFPVARTRSLHRFADLSAVMASGRSTEREQEEWFRENGPQVPALIEHIRRHGAGYDRLLFWSFRYFQTFFGLPLVADRAILVPTAEEDPIVRLKTVKALFSKPAGFLFVTPEEEALVRSSAERALAPSCVVGIGLDPARRDSANSLESVGIKPPFVLFLGRVDPNKGCGTLLRYFTKYQEKTGSDIPLVLAGPVNMPIPDLPFIKPLGYVDDQVREALLWNASALVMPSRFESLSIVLLEAWNHGRPALVNGYCAVLKGQAKRSGGALWYRSHDEFAHALNYLLTNRTDAEALGQQGLAYVNREYRWPVVMERVETVLRAAGREKT